MLTIYNYQLDQLSWPVRERLIHRAIETLKTDYSDEVRGRSDNELLTQAMLLNKDIDQLGFQLADTTIAYFVICLRYQTEYNQLMYRHHTQRILSNSGLHEGEKVYLLDEILMMYGI